MRLEAGGRRTCWYPGLATKGWPRRRELRLLRGRPLRRPARRQGARLAAEIRLVILIGKTEFGLFPRSSGNNRCNRRLCRGWSRSWSWSWSAWGAFGPLFCCRHPLFGQSLGGGALGTKFLGQGIRSLRRTALRHDLLLGPGGWRCGCLHGQAWSHGGRFCHRLGRAHRGCFLGNRLRGLGELSRNPRQLLATNA